MTKRTIKTSYWKSQVPGAFIVEWPNGDRDVFKSEDAVKAAHAKYGKRLKPKPEEMIVSALMFCNSNPDND